MEQFNMASVKKINLLFLNISMYSWSQKFLGRPVATPLNYTHEI